ncbi:hypothetical protein BD410DRAFT_725254, partial [Rickenella mellea]
NIDQLVLSGVLFNDSSRSSSPTRSRSASPEHDWPHSAHNSDYEADVARNASQQQRQQQGTQQSIGMGPGRTGVKGVIRDRAEAQEMERSRRMREVDALNRTMEKASLGGKTFLEEEREREWERMMLEGLDAGTSMVQLHRPHARDHDVDRDLMPRRGKGTFGHLREVGAGAFVDAVEREPGHVWVVVHIYDQKLERCNKLDATLVQLAHVNLQTKFLRLRAGAIGFAAVPSTSTHPSPPKLAQAQMQTRIPTRSLRNSSTTYTDEDDEDDSGGGEEYQYEDDVEDEGDEEDGREKEADVDLDMLPTLLVYKAGVLVHNWVRVDWEAGRGGVEELLSKNHILQSLGRLGGNCGLPSDDEDDLLDSDVDSPS